MYMYIFYIKINCISVFISQKKQYIDKQYSLLDIQTVCILMPYAYYMNNLYIIIKHFVK